MLRLLLNFCLSNIAMRYYLNEVYWIRIMSASKPYISSEKYRQMLVRDGDRRFQDWHSSFLNYQREYLEDLNKRRVK